MTPGPHPLCKVWDGRVNIVGVVYPGVVGFGRDLGDLGRCIDGWLALCITLGAIGSLYVGLYVWG